MRTTRIELDGAAGHVAIERPRGARTFRIDSILRDPARGQEVWKIWDIDAASRDEVLLAIAGAIQERTDGCRGTSSMVHEYFRELQRFQD